MTLQPGILALGTRSHYYLEFDAGGDAGKLLEVARDALAQPRSTTGGVNVVVGFSGSAWARATRAVAPVAAFTPVIGPDGFTMLAAQHDVWVWVSGATSDVVFDTARAVAASFAGVARLADHRAGFTYLDSRDLSGFEDGTENPPVNEAAEIITIADGQAGVGGSLVLVQRWVHDLASLHALDLHAQERIIGRTKSTSDELDGDELLETAHISRVVIEDADGEELELFRRSTSFGDVEEHGLIFVGFSPDAGRLATMLDRMAGNDGPRDALTTWSTPVTGAYYFVPPIEDV